MTLLPDDFADLAPYAARWCLATESERWATRLDSSMSELTEFYHASLDRISAAMGYCDRFPLDDMPEDARNLLHLVFSFVMVSFAVELWGQPWVPDCKGTRFDRIAEPAP
jgi:hypothetical protein